MNEQLKIILNVILVIVILYTSFAFVIGELNPTLWDVGARTRFIYLAVVGVCVSSTLKDIDF